MQNKNSIRFYVKKEIKTKQGYDQKNVPKINVEQIKGNEEFYFFLYPLGT